MTREQKDNLKEPEQNNVALAIFQNVELISFHPKQGFDLKNAVRVKEKVNSQWRNKKHKTKVSITVSQLRDIL